MRLIGGALAALALHLTVQSTLVLVSGDRAVDSPGGIAWTELTAVVMFTLAAGKARTGAALDNLVLGWWWADPAAGYVLVGYAVREVRAIFVADEHGQSTMDFTPRPRAGPRSRTRWPAGSGRG